MGTTKIKGDMSPFEMMEEIAAGNYGARRVCAEMLAKTEQIDPQAALGGIAHILTLDMLNIYGARVWMLYKDVCGEDLVKMIGVIRAYQLGGLAGCTRAVLDHAIDHRGDGLDVDAAVAAVRKKLPKFGLVAAVEDEGSRPG